MASNVSIISYTTSIVPTIKVDTIENMFVIWIDTIEFNSDKYRQP